MKYLGLFVPMAVFAALMSFPVSAPVRAATLPSCVGCSFAGADLHGQNLQNVNYVGADFRHADLQGADLRGARLTGADFADADLRGADLRGARLTGCNLERAKLGGAKFDGARLTGVNVSGELDTMSDAELRGLFGDCTGCNAARLDLHGRDLSGIKIIGGDLSGVNASGTAFTNANLVGVSFRNAALQNASFKGAAICWHNTDSDHGIVEHRETDCIDLSGAGVRGTNFQGALICDNDRGTRSCAPVDAAMLRDFSRSSLAGAILP